MKNESLRFIVLIPHKDALLHMDDYKQTLWKNGFAGAYSFPAIIPFIMTKQSYSSTELKNIVMFLKKMICSKNQSGKFFSQKAETIHLFSDFSLGGLSFDFSCNDFPLKKDDEALPRFLLGFSLLKNGTENDFLLFANENPFPHISFRACSVANMIFCISEDGTFSWEIGHPVWLGKK
jgi:hypothetical protein